MKKGSKNKTIQKLLQDFNNIGQRIKKIAATLKSRAGIFFLFVSLSTILWFYRALDDTFVATITYPVRYQNLPKNKTLANTPPQRLELQVRGNGYTILGNKLSFKTPLDFNVNSFLLYSQANDSMSVYIRSRTAKEALSEELNRKNTDLEILSISPDTIFFTFTRTKAKKLPVVADLELNENSVVRQHMINGKVIAVPDSIEVIGPAFIVDTMKAVYTKKINPQNLEDTLIDKVEIKEYSRIETPLKKATIIIPVDRFTELNYTIPITTLHAPDSINLKLFPRNITVSFNIAHSHINKISDTDFRAYVNYTDLTESNTPPASLPVNIEIPGEYVHNARISPSSVEYIKELNNAQSRYNRRNR